MESALAWIGKIAEWVGQFIPRYVQVRSTHEAVKFTRGRIKHCLPGMCWYWPLFTEWVEYPVVRQTDRLETQTMESKDGITFLVQATITYSVSDLKALLESTHNALIAVVDIAMAAVHDVCCDYTWAELQQAQRKGTLKTQLRLEAQKQLADYGIRVIKLQLNALARARVYRVAQSTSTEEN